jgi:hypothetical protein
MVRFVRYHPVTLISRLPVLFNLGLNWVHVTVLKFRDSHGTKYVHRVFWVVTPCGAPSNMHTLHCANHRTIFPFVNTSKQYVTTPCWAPALGSDCFDDSGRRQTQRWFACGSRPQQRGHWPHSLFIGLPAFLQMDFSLLGNTQTTTHAEESNVQPVKGTEDILDVQICLPVPTRKHELEVIRQAGNVFVATLHAPLTLMLTSCSYNATATKIISLHVSLNRDRCSYSPPTTRKSLLGTRYTRMRNKPCVYLDF